VNLATIIIFATGPSHADKAAMIEAARARGWDVRSDDEGQAAVLSPTS